jgi:serine/tyrosine/threonine adenylyltransferase
MDYGPFGFMEEYDPLFAKWTGSGQHFGFLNQPSAAFANYGVLVESVVPVIAAAQGRTEHETIQNDFLEKAQVIFQNKVDEVFRIKLGFNDDHDAADDVWEALEPLLRNSRVDYTLFFRELSYIVRDTPNLFVDTDVSISADTLLTRLIGDDNIREGSSPFYEELTEELREKWITWIQMWCSVLKTCCNDSSDNGTSSCNLEGIAQRMLRLNPKYVLREWMLVEAYQKATHENDEGELLTLYNLIQHPYDEGTTYETNKYYRRAPDDALVTGGTAFMS